MQNKNIRSIIIILSIILSLITALIVVLGDYISIGGIVIVSGLDLLKFSFNIESTDFTDIQALLYIASLCSLLFIASFIGIAYTGIRILVAKPNAKLEKINKTYFSDTILLFVLGLVYLISFLVIQNKIPYKVKLTTNAFYPLIPCIIVAGCNLYYKIVIEKKSTDNPISDDIATPQKSVDINTSSINKPNQIECININNLGHDNETNSFNSFAHNDSAQNARSFRISISNFQPHYKDRLLDEIKEIEHIVTANITPEGILTCYYDDTIKTPSDVASLKELIKSQITK